MTLKFSVREGREWRNVTCDPIYDKGHHGQVVILDRVALSSGDPLSGYSQPCAFRIDEDPDDRKSYILVDTCGVGVRTPRSVGAYLYPVNHWLGWKQKADADWQQKADADLERLHDRVALLTDIIVKQGYRIISEEQAKKLGLKN